MTCEATPRIASTWTSVDGLRMHARIAGNPARTDRPPVVLVHGLGVSSRYFVPAIGLLSRDHRVYAPDLPGFGLSAKPAHVLDVPELAGALAAWMDAQALTHAAMIGNSLGCQVIAELAVRRPELVERAVLSGPTTDPYSRNALRQLFLLLLDAPRERPSQVALALRDYLRAGPLRVAQTFGYGLRDRIETKLPCMTMPVLIVRGMRDPIVSQRWAEEAALLLPRGWLKILPGSPHSSHYSTPLQFVRVVRPFLMDAADRSCGERDTQLLGNPMERQA